LTRNGVSRGVTIVRAMVDLIGETAPANWTFFHLSVRVLWQPFIPEARRKCGSRQRKIQSLNILLTAKESHPSSGSLVLARYVLRGSAEVLPAAGQ
ncbi:MAG: hypothetical protein H0U54_07435, partial [Acidobacteria bacterium]|nr:hypothetical protein [Acidobacteriota bacterium]